MWDGLGKQYSQSRSTCCSEHPHHGTNTAHRLPIKRQPTFIRWKHNPQVYMREKSKADEKTASARRPPRYQLQAHAALLRCCLLLCDAPEKQGNMQSTSNIVQYCSYEEDRKTAKYKGK